VSRELREFIGDWLMVISSAILLVSLFLPWSHQFSREFAAAFAGTNALSGIPRDPTAWQVYSLADVLLALLALSVFVLALVGPRRPRVVALGLTVLALAFVIHALGRPPTSGANLASPADAAPSINGIPAADVPALAAPTPSVPANHPGSAAGEVVAVAALLVAAAGLGLSLSAD